MAKKSKLTADFDPEDDHHGDHTSAAKLLTRTESGREHYANLPGRRIRAGDEEKEGLGAGKYAGERTSRAALDLVSSSSEEESVDEDAEYPEPDLSFTENEEDGDEGVVDAEERSKRLVEELRQLQVEEEAQLQLMSTRATDDVERGRHVRNQYGVWEKVLDLRVQLQPLLAATNRLPSACEVLAFDGDEGLQAERESALKGLDGLIAGLLSVQETLMEQDRLPVKRRAQEAMDVESLWKRACRLETGLLASAHTSLDAWHQKAVLASDASNKKQLRVINQGIWQQVESAMRDPERLLSRTHILRQGSAQRIACPADDEYEDAEGNRSVFPDIFDDTDFYQQHLLRDWVEANPARQADAAMLAGTGLAVRMVQRGPAASGRVERRASKGRKLRYDVHEKLVNYMVPMHCGQVPWAEDKVSELFASLLAH